MRRKTS